ncbi:hypothetical protein B5S52_05365 [Pectobacterium brasiliense]|uniref:hypothetical protein n=1 Tax=Pectobacterium brasiliense TaxID=180957 RepID=UPI0009AF531F|nr:hypothetical protein [Pectobacterium brasiliense]ARA75344.1 hypothetical protein B5S52_05365 [Pectobacterium brasiliense]MBN3192171.1 hypothetical protein [Pectobacterium brasiliense]
MFKHLTISEIDTIKKIIIGWSGKITWSMLCEKIEKTINKNPSRQALTAHKDILTVFQEKKKGIISENNQLKRPANLIIAAKHIASLEADLAFYKRENSNLKEDNMIMKYNFYRHGFKQHQIYEPLPEIDRERNDLKNR